MKIVTASQMRDIEKKAIESLNIPSIVLMENAALYTSLVCLDKLMEYDNPKAVIVCGKGNNGGDGLAIARQLFLKGIDVSVILACNIEDYNGDAKINASLAEKIGIPIITDFEKAALIIKNAHIVVDAMLGTGITGNVGGLYEKYIKLINESQKYVISVDIPSGINGNTGQLMGCAVKASKTLTYGFIKTGLVLYPGAEYAGEIIKADIGIPFDTEDLKINTLTEAECSELLPKRIPRSNKGTYGKVLSLCGCDEMPGAAVMSTLTAYKTGSGLVRCASTKGVTDVVHNQIKEAVTSILPDADGFLCKASFNGISKILNDHSVIVLGPGIGKNQNTFEFVSLVIKNASIPIILDADGLNVVSENPDMLKDAPISPIITPHIGEMSRLSGKDTQYIKENLIETATAFSSKYNVITVLKDAKTIIASPNGDIYINQTGNSSMAKAGSGDVLTGIIAALIAQGIDPFTAAFLGTFLHGKAGEYASTTLGLHGVMATDIINQIPLVIRDLYGESKKGGK